MTFYKNMSFGVWKYSNKMSLGLNNDYLLNTFSGNLSFKFQHTNKINSRL